MWLMSVSPVGLAAAARVVAVRVWPASTYTRVTVESNHVLKYRQFALSNPERVVVDLEGVNLNSVLKGMGGQIRADDPFIKSARVGQFDPQTVRMVFELKQNVKPQLFALAPVAGFKERLVMDLYPANATDVQDPLLALLEDYNKGDLERQVPPAQSGPQPGKAGRDRPIVIMLDPGHGGEDSGAGHQYRGKISRPDAERLGSDRWGQQERRPLCRPHHVRYGAVPHHRRQPQIRKGGAGENGQYQ